VSKSVQSVLLGFKGFAQTKQSVTDRIKNVKLGFKDLEQAKQS